MRRLWYIWCAIVIFGCGNKEEPKEYKNASYEAKIDSLHTRVSDLEETIDRMNTVPMPHEFYFCGERVPLEKWWVHKKLEEALKFYVSYSSGRRRIDMYLREVTFYFPYLEERFTSDTLLNKDLKYIPLAESEFNSNARSGKNAVGSWQIIRSTARERNLKITKYIDERKDFERATRAAIEKLKDDHEEFGDWFLAIAAYNVGRQRILNALREQKDSSYFNLILPEETADYLYRQFALKLILEHPDIYGFKKRPEDIATFTMIEYQVPKKCLVIDIAHALSIPPQEFKLLNPKFTAREVLPGTYQIKIPAPADSTDK